MPSINLAIEFDSRTQSLAALRAAAYRLIGKATCTIEKTDDGSLVCRLTPQPKLRGDPIETDALRVMFLDLVTDENLREVVASKSEPVRNLILSLAFGALAQPSEKSKG